MKIQNLELRHFRNHATTFMEFGKLNYIMGKNGAGKTSIKAALQLALTGETEWGSKLKDLIRDGQTESLVEVEVENIGTVKRTIGQKGNIVEINGKKIPDKEALKVFQDEFQVSYTTLSCAVTASKFLNMKPSEQKDFLFRLTNAALNPNAVVSLMDNPTDEAKTLVLNALPANVAMEDLDALYSDFFAFRKTAKKDRDALKAKLPIVAASLAAIPQISETYVELNAIIKELNKRRDEILGKVSVITEKSNQRDRLARELAKVEQLIADLDAKADKNLDMEDAEGTILGFVGEIADLEKKIEGLKAIFNTLSGQNASLSGILSKLNTKNCPLSDKLICNTDKSFLTDELQAQIDGNKLLMSDAKAQWDAFGAELVSTKTKKAEVEKQILLNAELKRNVERRLELEKETQGIVVEDKTALLAEVTVCETEIKAAHEKKNMFEQRDLKVAEIAQTEASLAVAEQSVVLYEYLVKEFSPSGVKARALAQIIQPIEDHCNKTFMKLTNGYTMRIDCNDGFSVIVQTRSGNVPMDSMSNSEKLRIGMVFQDAINALTNVRVLFVDNAEILDAENHKLMVELLGEIKDNYDSIFVIQTADDFAAMAALFKTHGATIGVNDVKVFKVTNGTVSIL